MTEGMVTIGGSLHRQSRLGITRQLISLVHGGPDFAGAQQRHTLGKKIRYGEALNTEAIFVESYVPVQFMLQYEVFISGCQDSQQISFPHFATVLALSTPISAPSCLGAACYNSPPIPIDS